MIAIRTAAEPTLAPMTNPLPEAEIDEEEGGGGGGVAVPAAGATDAVCDAVPDAAADEDAERPLVADAEAVTLGLGDVVLEDCADIDGDAGVPGDTVGDGLTREQRTHARKTYPSHPAVAAPPGAPAPQALP